MSDYFTSGHAVDLVLAVMVLEMAVLFARRSGERRSIVLTFVPGMLILLALRAALIGADWSLIALPLALAFPAHLADLWSRGLLRR